MSVYGRSPNGKIHHNRIYFNKSNDEGGGIMIAGAAAGQPRRRSRPGTGPVDIYDNLIQANLANDDGGGIRFLMAGGGHYPMNVYNNIDREQRLHPRGRRHRHQRRTERADLQQHDHEEPHHGDRGHLRRHPGAGRRRRPRRNSDQLQATLPAGRRRSATRCCSTTSSGTTGPAPGPARPVTGIGLAGDASADRPLGPRSSPTAPASWRRRTRWSSRTPASTPTRPAPEQHGQPGRRRAVRRLGELRHLAAEPRLRRRHPGRRRGAGRTSWATTT